MVERWLPVVGFEGRYEVSDLGRVRTVPRVGTRIVRGVPQTHTVPGGIKKAFKENGYFRVGLWDGKRSQSKYVHHLVLEAFVGPRPPGHECCHGLAGVLDNRLPNLRWDTRLENARDLVRHGTHHHTRKTHCIHGHPFDERNTRLDPRGRRVCRTCSNKRGNEHAKRKRRAHV